MEHPSLEFDFLNELDHELEKINLFFSEKISYCLRTGKDFQLTWNKVKLDKSLYKKKIKIVKQAIPELYLLAKK